MTSAQNSSYAKEASFGVASPDPFRRFIYFILFFFFLRKISPELTSAADPSLFAEED